MKIQENQSQEQSEKHKSLKVSLIVFTVVLLLILGVYFYLKNLLPDYIFSQGKKYLNAGQYEKALKMFSIAANAMPYESDPVYYEVLALSKLPSTYENQKLLYEIAQLDDCEEASNLADKILMEMRTQIDKQVGDNYIDNVLFDDVLVRWNNSQPITYAIFSDINVPNENIVAVRKAFSDWQTITGDKITFKETDGNKNANICVKFVDAIDSKQPYDIDAIGKTVPSINDNVLQKMDIYIKKTNKKGLPYSYNQILPLAQHEIGHALGLGGHSSDKNDIMYYEGDYINENTINKHLSARDLNTINLLYKMIPDVIDKPIDPSQYSNFFYHELLTTYPGANFELEIQRLISQLKNDQKNIIVWVDLAINYAYKKQYARSNYILTKVLPLVQIDLQNQHVVLYNLAVNSYKMKNYKEAFKYLSLAENIKTDLDTQILGAFINIKMNNIALGKKKLELLLQKYPDNIEVALKLAELYHMKKDEHNEQLIIDNLLKVNPQAMRDRRVFKYKMKQYNKKGAVYKINELKK
jgi:predicted Zn-dependent protease